MKKYSVLTRKNGAYYNTSFNLWFTVKAVSQKTTWFIIAISFLYLHFKKLEKISFDSNETKIVIAKSKYLRLLTESRKFWQFYWQKTNPQNYWRAKKAIC